MSIYKMAPARQGKKNREQAASVFLRALPTELPLNSSGWEGWIRTTDTVLSME